MSLRQAVPGGDPPTSAAGDQSAAGDKAAASPATVELVVAPATDQPAAAATGQLAATPARHRRSVLGHAARAVRSTVGWTRRPGGRLVLTGLLLTVLVGVTGAAGAYLVPAAVRVDAEQAADTDNDTGQGVQDLPSASASLPASVPSVGQALTPSVTPTSSANAVGVAGPRPADALSGWAQQMSTKVDISAVALEAYGYAELVLAQTTPACRLSWTTLAAIGKVESNHGTSNNAILYPDGRAMPSIIGLPLDGKDGRARIPDTDGGNLDNDPVWDRAVGPMQFIPTTWKAYAVDADNDTVRDPNDIDDAALAAANYLCAGGRDLATSEGWWQAVAAYNRPQSYGAAVFAAANTYGTRSRT